ncbi:MAG: MFS transporter [Acidothermaceae bacterium]
MKHILKHDDVRRLILATALSALGDSALWLALGIWVKQLTGSNAAAGMVFFTFLLPSVFAPLAGLVVDRLAKRTVLRFANAGTLVLVCGLFFVHGAAAVWLIYLVVLGQGAANTFLGSASSALLPTLLAESELAAANGVRQSANELMRLIAPLVGAGLFGLVGPRAVVAALMCTYGLAAVMFLRLRAEGRAGERVPQRWRAELSAGVAHIWKTAILRQLLGSVAVSLLVAGFFETIDFALVSQGLHRSPSFVGVLFMAQGVTAVPGGLTAGAAVRRFGETKAAAIGMALVAVGSALCVDAQLVVIVTGIAILGFGVPWLVVALFTAVQRCTPMPLQGRVFSATDTMTSTPQTMSIALGASLSTLVPYRILLCIVAAVIAGCSAYLATRPQRDIRGGDGLSTSPDAAEAAARAVAMQQG